MRRSFTPLTVAAIACVLVACGGGTDAPVTAASAERASAMAAGGAAARAGSPYRIQVPGGAAARLDSRLRAARGPVDVWVSLEQNSVAAQRASLAEAAGLTDRTAARGSAAVRDGVRAHRQRIAEAQGGLASQLSSLGGKEWRGCARRTTPSVRIDAAQLRQVAALQGVASAAGADYQST